MISDYDIIFAGGGTTACVIAGRLAAADNTLKILILENGPQTQENPLYIQPARFLDRSGSLSKHTTRSDINIVDHKTGPPAIFHGNCVGGGGSINTMVYNRAPASDYNDWMHLGNPGWGAADLLPFAKKLETYQLESNNTTHGSSGPIKVSHGGYKTEVGKNFLAAAAQFPRGRTFSEDLNDFSTCNVYGKFPKYIDTDSGRRSDTAHCYVYNQAYNPKLCILDHARVNRVLINGDACATGIEYQMEGKDSPMLTAHASRLVVISAGTFCSPAILERRSGIGGKDFLEKHDIMVMSDLPGVGLNYNGHHGAIVPYLAPGDQVMLSKLARNDASGMLLAVLFAITHHMLVAEVQWYQNGKGILASNGVDAGIKVRPNGQDLENLGPLFNQRWESFFARALDKPVLCLLLAARYYYSFSSSFTLTYLYPMTTGQVHIQSRNPFSPLNIGTGMLASDADLLLLRWSYKWKRELVRRMANYRGELASGHPKFAEDSQAACGVADGPVDISSAEIKYSKVDDEVIDNFHRENSSTLWHATGTCAMKPRNQCGVVDSQLNVYGIRKLKVADLSIAPLSVGANSYHTALMIGEKAAVIIGHELGIQGV
ncbi:GMC oxidoreductase-domain-containing protein [Mycena crocata]|nr:GMC oxidoreductase-domain-containing protein [Mycena crocata]